jgi:hypothetical protein
MMICKCVFLSSATIPHVVNSTLPTLISSFLLGIALIPALMTFSSASFSSSSRTFSPSYTPLLFLILASVLRIAASSAGVRSTPSSSSVTSSDESVSEPELSDTGADFFDRLVGFVGLLLDAAADDIIAICAVYRRVDCCSDIIQLLHGDPELCIYDVLFI